MNNYFTLSIYRNTLRYIFFLFFICCLSSAFGQKNSRGKDFWLMFNQNYSLDGELVLFITGDVNTSGTVTIPGLAFTQNFSVTAGIVTSVTLPVAAQFTTSDVIENKAIHVTSSDNVVVYGLNRLRATTDAFLGIPTSALGLEHLIMSYSDNGLGSLLGIVASEDNTKVTITPSGSTSGHAVGIPYNITLNKNQAYQLKGSGSDLTGTIVVGDKPIGVYGGHVCANVPLSQYACDHLVEQLPSTDTWGKDFITASLSTRTGGDIFRVLASKNGTVVKLNGVTVATLNRGKYYELDLPSNSYNEITTSEPCLVAQFCKGTDADGVTSDPFMSIIPPKEQYFGSTVFSTPASGFSGNFVNIITKNAGVGVIKLDGVTIPASNYAVIGTSGFSGARIPVTLGSHALTAPNVAFGAFVYGFNDADSYGYPAGQLYSAVATAASLTLTPTTNSVASGTNNCLTATLTDQNNLPVVGARIDFNITGVNGPLSTFGFTDANGKFDFCYTGNNAGADNIDANLGSLSAAATVNWTAGVVPSVVLDVSPSNTICSGTLVIFKATPTKGGTAPVYKWFKNSITISGEASAILERSDLVNGDIIQVEMTSNEQDANPATVLSNTITMVVNSLPKVSGPANLLDNNTTGQCGKIITYNTSTTGTPTPSVSYTLTGATTASGSGNGSGTFFNVGKTTVTLTATNSCGTGTYSFDVTVNETEKPVFTSCPTNMTVDNTVGRCDAVVNFAVIATDNCTSPQAVSQTAGLASGAVFPVGTTTNSFTATDGVGNAVAAPCTFTVTVKDAEKPVFTSCPTNMTVNNTIGRCDAVVNFAVTATDNCTSPQAVSQTAGLASGAVFPVGTTTNSFTATDGVGNAAGCMFTITVKDTEKPKFTTCAPSQTIALGSFECSRVVTFANPSVSDNCSATFERTDAFKTTLNSGSSFGAGTYPLSYRATDAAGNFADCNFTIQVNGQSTSGRLTCIPTLTVALDERQCTNTIDAAGLLIDNTYYCANSYSASIAGRTNTTLSSADIGKTFTVTVRDNSNNNCSTVVTVVDTKAPVLNAPLDVAISCTEVSRDGRILATLSQPTTISECGRITFTTQDRVINLPAGQTSFDTKPDGFPADKNFNFTLAYNANRIIIRTYTATDESNNSSSIKQAIYVKNIELSQVQCPKDVTLSCTQSGFSTNIQSTGTPFVNNGRLTQDVSCGIDYLYADERTNTTQGYVIKRTWTLISRLNNQRQNCVQTITVNCVNIPLLALSGSISKETGESVSAMVKVSNPTDMMGEMQGGTFIFNNLTQGNSYRIQPERDNDVTNGVSTFDIALLSKHILGIQPFTSPYQMIAADVNRDGEIDGSDMVLIRNLILRRITRFPSNTAWRFIPKSFVFRDNKNPFADDFPEVLNYTNLSSNMEKADFVAVKVGDVNLNARAANVLSLATRTARPTENIYLTDKKMEAGKEYIFDVNIKNSTLKALQLALKIDKTQVISFNVETGNLPQFETGNLEVNQKQGIVGMAWANTSKSKVLDENSIIQLKITPRQSAWLHELVSLDEQNMENLVYDTEGGIEKQIQLKFNTLKTETPEFDLHQNRPNPFTTETTISFILPETNNAILSIYDVNGREVYTLKQAFNKGYNELKLDNTVLKNAGIYFYRLQSDKFTAVKRLQYFVN